MGDDLDAGDAGRFVLSAVRRLPAAPGQPRDEPFALELTRPGPPVAQGLVVLRHDAIGQLEIFVVPEPKPRPLAGVDRSSMPDASRQTSFN